jgi:hypothetical protein
MSEWTKIRDGIVNALKVDEVTEEIKQNVSKAIVDEVLPPIEECVEEFIAKIQTQAGQEHGWCRIRDAVILPVVMRSLVYVVRLVLTKTLDIK